MLPVCGILSSLLSNVLGPHSKSKYLALICNVPDLQGIDDLYCYPEALLQQPSEIVECFRQVSFGLRLACLALLTYLVQQRFTVLQPWNYGIEAVFLLCYFAIKLVTAYVFCPDLIVD